MTAQGPPRTGGQPATDSASELLSAGGLRQRTLYRTIIMSAADFASVTVMVTVLHAAAAADEFSATPPPPFSNGVSAWNGFLRRMRRFVFSAK